MNFQPPDPVRFGSCVICHSLIEESEQSGGVYFECQPTEAGKEPAFPVAANEYAGHGPSHGITIRDYFAAKAMQAQLSRMNSGPGNAKAADRMTRETAEYAYAIADAMLAARVKP